MGEIKEIMIISSNQIKSKLSPVVQRLMDDVLAKSDGSLPLEFGDAEEYRKTYKQGFPDGVVACLIPVSNRYIICIKQLNPITTKEENGIAHELGHLWLSFHGFPREKRYNSDEKQKMYDICFGPLREVMEHTIFYPWLKANYEIDLYKVGKQRLVDFLDKELPNRKIESEGDQVSLILNYLKFKVESDDNYWLGRLDKAYSKDKFKDLKEMAEKVLPIIQELASKPLNPQSFIEKYRKVLETMNIKHEIWPDFTEAIS